MAYFKSIFRDVFMGYEKFIQAFWKLPAKVCQDHPKTGFLILTATNTRFIL